MSRAMLLVTLALAALLAGCDDHSDGCESVCRSFLFDCGVTAWADVEQCTAGSGEDLYRRTDADEVLACYEAAIAVPTRAQAEAKVDAAFEAGLFGEILIGMPDRDTLVEQAIQSGTCDVFEVVQCKVEAVQEPASGALIR